VELRTVQLLLSLSLMAHAVQVTLAWELSDSSLDLNEHVRMFFCYVFPIIDSKTTITKANY